MSIDNKAFEATLKSSDFALLHQYSLRDAIEAYEAAKGAEQPVECRAAFEEWVIALGGDPVRQPGQDFYLALETTRAWRTWQAAWDARDNVREIVEVTNTDDIYAAIRKSGRAIVYGAHVLPEWLWRAGFKITRIEDGGSDGGI